MRSEAQIIASRANGAKSRGPITNIGRAISAQNSATHGLAGAKLVVIEGQNLRTAGKLSLKPAIANSNPKPISKSSSSPKSLQLAGAFAAAGQWKLPSSIWNRKAARDPAIRASRLRVPTRSRSP
jgi:hypothetical protein